MRAECQCRLGRSLALPRTTSRLTPREVSNTRSSPLGSKTRRPLQPADSRNDAHPVSSSLGGALAPEDALTLRGAIGLIRLIRNGHPLLPMNSK